MNLLVTSFSLSFFFFFFVSAFLLILTVNRFAVVNYVNRHESVLSPSHRNNTRSVLKTKGARLERLLLALNVKKTVEVRPVSATVMKT